MHILYLQLLKLTEKFNAENVSIVHVITGASYFSLEKWTGRNEQKRYRPNIRIKQKNVMSKILGKGSDMYIKP